MGLSEELRKGAKFSGIERSSVKQNIVVGCLHVRLGFSGQNTMWHYLFSLCVVEVLFCITTQMGMPVCTQLRASSV